MFKPSDMYLQAFRGHSSCRAGWIFFVWWMGSFCHLECAQRWAFPFRGGSWLPPWSTSATRKEPQFLVLPRNGGMWVRRCRFQISGQAGKINDVNASQGLSPWAQEFWQSMALGYILSALWEEGRLWPKSVLLLLVPLCDFLKSWVSALVLSTCWGAALGRDQKIEDQDRENSL